MTEADRQRELEGLVAMAVAVVRGAAKRAERKAAYYRQRAPQHMLSHLDRACLWRGWLNRAEALVPDLEASMPEDFLRDFHNANDLADLATLRTRLREIDDRSED